MKLTRRVGFAALALSMALVLVSQAFADVKVNVNAGGGSATSRMRFKIEGVNVDAPCGVNPTQPEPLWPNNPPNGVIAYYCLGPVNPDDNFAVGRTTYNGAVASASAWCYGDATVGGENQLSSAPDTAYASVGLYEAPGGTNLGSDPDSLLRVNITRTAGNVALTFPAINASFASGGLQVRSVGGNQTTIAEFRLIVYPTQAAADADVNTDGTGSAYFGRIKLETGAGVPSQVVPVTGFAPGDFALINEGGGKYTARPIANLTKNVPVANSANAVVVLYADPTSVDRPVTVPSNTPFGLALLALALMASGVWVISARRRAQAV